MIARRLHLRDQQDFKGKAGAAPSRIVYNLRLSETNSYVPHGPRLTPVSCHDLSNISPLRLTSLATRSHAQYAWMPVWDDHEVADNAYRDGSSFLNNTEESFELSGGVSVDQRKMNAVRAYFEWMPIQQVDLDDNLRIWRSFALGKPLDLIMLDTRHYDRSIPPLLGQGNDEYIAKFENDASRTLMGSNQENWYALCRFQSDEQGNKLAPDWWIS